MLLAMFQDAPEVKNWPEAAVWITLIIAFMVTNYFIWWRK